MKIINPIRLFAVLCVAVTLGRFRELSASVRCLLLASSPANISRRVIAVIINALNRISGGWSRSNMGEKGFETGAPFFGDLNSATAVSGKVFDVRIGASTLHRGPNRILGGSVSPAAIPVSGPIRALHLNAAAAFCAPASELINRHGRHSPARTLANPFWASGSIGPMESLQATKGLPCKIKSLHGGNFRRRDAQRQAEIAA